PPTFPTGFNFGALINAANGSGSVFVAPPNVSGSAGTFGGELPRPNPGFQDLLRAGGIGTFGGGGTAKPSFLGSLGKSLGSLAPLLGFSLGSGIGGTSTAGNILGSLGGLGAGIGIGSLIAGASAPGAFGSVLGLSSIAGPIGLAAAPLLLA